MGIRFHRRCRTIAACDVRRSGCGRLDSSFRHDSAPFPLPEPARAILRIVHGFEIKRSMRFFIARRSDGRELQCLLESPVDFQTRRGCNRPLGGVIREHDAVGLCATEPPKSDTIPLQWRRQLPSAMRPVRGVRSTRNQRQLTGCTGQRL